MCMQCFALDPSKTTYDDHGLESLGTGSVQDSYSETSAGKPVYTLDEIADYLTNGFWSDFGTVNRKFDVQSGGTLTYNIDGLDAEGRDAALTAMDAWTAVSGLQFQAASASTAQLFFDDNNSGAYASSLLSGNTITRSNINVDDAWQAYGDYYLQTYIHEIGHALGLGHTGDYNGSARYSTDAAFANDSWQMSVMSYFDQNENTWTNASWAYLATAQMADILAIQNLYGVPTNVQAGNTIYGDGNNTGQFGMDLPSNKAVTIFDSAGNDTINLASRAFNQRIDLRAESFSDINGRLGNLGIARNTVIENATTGNGADSITGNDVANVLSSGAGNDVLIGNGGHDRLIGGVGQDTLTGGSGGDRFVFEGLGEAGDTITDFDLAQGDRVDVSTLLSVAGYSGSDPVADGVVYLTAGSGGSWLVVDLDGSGSGAGVQVVFLQGVAQSADVSQIIDLTGLPPDEPTPEVTSDTVITLDNTYVTSWVASRSIIRDTDGGTDTLDLSAVTYASSINLTSGVNGKVGSKVIQIADGTVIENLLLGRGNDTGTGNAAANQIDGGAGNDKMYGMDGDDALSGGLGNDMLYGGEGGDDISAGEGNDRLYGDAGDDSLYGDLGNDLLYGGAGNDAMDGGDGNDKLYGNDGDDVMDGGDGNNSLYGGLGNDTLIGGIGKDYLKGEDGNDVMDGGDGDDKLYGNDGDDELVGGIGKDYLKGDAGDDTLDGGDGDDKLYGNDGADLILGGAGKDYLKGDAGNDMLDGGDGDDKLYGNDGDDQMFGGEGKDYLRGDKGDDSIDGGAGDDKLYGNDGNDILNGGDGLDYLKGDKGDDFVDGGAGNDKLYGDDGADIIKGDDGDDYINAGKDNDIVTGGAGIDKIYGDAGDDDIDGGAGVDTIDAGAGNDVIAGGEGADVIKGGSGADTFVFTTVADAGDRISDVRLGDGDKFDISGLMTELGLSVSSAIASGALTLEADGRSSWLTVDADGSGGNAPLQIVFIQNLSSATELTTDWLV